MLAKSYRNLKTVGLFFPNQWQKILIVNIRILILKPATKKKHWKIWFIIA